MSSYLYKYYYTCVMYFLYLMNCSLRMLIKTIMFASIVHSLKNLQLTTGVQSILCTLFIHLKSECGK